MSSIQRQRFILVSIIPPFFSKEQADEDIVELKSLVDTYKGAKIVEIIQRRMHPDGATYIGSGKANEIAELVLKKKIDIIVINALVNPRQLFNITKLCWSANPRIQVWDRVDLILHIFKNHATTAESKLQIKLAEMRHMGPRIYGLGSSFSQQAGGIGTRGLGETNVELMKRHWRNEMRRVRKELDKMEKLRTSQVKRRKDLGFKTVSIIGYTNAGKTSLFNLLTGKKKKEADVLFATLDSAVGHMYDRIHNRQVAISDTIGFIQNLPPTLIDAFKSTLMESIHADLLIHLIDISDPKMEEKIMVVESIISDLKLQEKPKIYVFNKVDRLDNYDYTELSRLFSSFAPQFISTYSGLGIKNLYYLILRILG